MAETRKPAWAGRFYPADASELKRTVAGFLDAAGPAEFKGDVLGGLVPHAGYVYSGPVAAHTYRALKGREIDTVVLLGACHGVSAPGLALDDHDAFGSPLGDVPVDTGLVRALAGGHPDIRVLRDAHAEEHSLEVQLPFLRAVLPDARIVPAATNVRDLPAAKELGEALGRGLKDRRAAVIVSADLSHFPSQKDSKRIDPACLQACASLNPDYFWNTERALTGLGIPELHCASCGAGAVTVGLSAVLEMGADAARALRYASSADTRGDPGRVVGYGAAVFLRTGEPRDERFFLLSDRDRADLLSIARGALERRLGAGAEPGIEVFDNTHLNLPCGVFVTWWKKGAAELELRGCVGMPYPEMSLGNAAARYAVTSALEDTRFPPVSREELKDLVCEVSVLSPMTPARREDIRPGIGVMMRRGGRRGLFLPEVWEKLPDKERFMGELCSQKVGVERDAWKADDAELYTFRTQVVMEGGSAS